MASGPQALKRFKEVSCVMTPLIEMLIGLIFGLGSFQTFGILVRSFFVKTPQKCSFKISVFEPPSMITDPLIFRSATAGSSFFSCLIYVQNRLGFSSVISPRSVIRNMCLLVISNSGAYVF